MCVDCVLASPRITQVDPGNEPLPEVVLSHRCHAARSGTLPPRWTMMGDSAEGFPIVGIS
jgi:hypothetical protein